ncbi:hypothetical protein NPIL_332881 [Nephila pilipes]|uniref:Uncharacterized protein n=1 Tax=Nephila pilipes TaxID=299642 RepID=A0A8X6PUC5_NEPPI|nr:hypothetical protein NPIL_332881 [Nephila pilipes]
MPQYLHLSTADGDNPVSRAFSREIEQNTQSSKPRNRIAMPISTRGNAAKLDVTQKTFWKVLHTAKIYSFYIKKVIPQLLQNKPATEQRDRWLSLAHIYSPGAQSSR